MSTPIMQHILLPPNSKTNRLNSNPKTYIRLDKHDMGHIGHIGHMLNICQIKHIGPYASNVYSNEDSFFIWFKRTLLPLMKYDQGKISEMRHI